MVWFLFTYKIYTGKPYINSYGGFLVMLMQYKTNHKFPAVTVLRSTKK
jgi:hypothetical protein